MFGISGVEFLVILVIAIAVIPARNWPDVAKFLAKVIKFVRDLIWKITDNVEQIKNQIDIDAPITDLSKKTMNDVMSAFSEPVKRAKKTLKKSSEKSPGPNVKFAKKKKVAR